MTPHTKLETVTASPVDVYDLGHDATRHLIAKHDPRANVVALTEHKSLDNLPDYTNPSVTIRTDQEAAKVIMVLRMAFPGTQGEGAE